MNLILSTRPGPPISNEWSSTPIGRCTSPSRLLVLISRDIHVSVQRNMHPSRHPDNGLRTRPILRERLAFRFRARILLEGVSRAKGTGICTYTIREPVVWHPEAYANRGQRGEV